MSATKTFEVAGVTWQVAPLDPNEQIEVECIIIRSLGPPAGAAAAALVQGIAPSLVEVLRDTVTRGSEVDLALDLVEQSVTDQIHETVAEREDGGLTLRFDQPANASAAAELVSEEFSELVFAEVRGSDVLVTPLPEVEKSAEKPFDLARLANLDTSDPRLSGAWDRLLEALGETGGDVIRDAVFTLAGRLDARDIMRLFDLVVLGKTYVRLGGNVVRKLDSYKVLGELLKHDPRAKWQLLGEAIMATYGREREAEAEGDA